MLSNASKTSGTVRGLAPTVKRLRIPHVAVGLLAVSIEIGIGIGIGIGIEIAPLIAVPSVSSTPTAIPTAISMPLTSGYAALTRSRECSGHF